MKMENIKSVSRVLLVFVVVVFAGVNAARAADKELKPYVLGSVETGSLGTVAMEVKQALMNEGFEVAGEYPPFEDAYVIVVTNDALKRNAARSEMGGFGAIQRIGLTKTEQGVQVSYTNPPYMANAYRMEGNLESVAEDLEAALGARQPHGAKGLTARELRNYHYKLFMPYFDEPYELKTFRSHRAAVQEVEQSLEQERGGVSKVYRVDIPGSQQTLFGVGMTEECSGDKFIMSTIDTANLRATPHLPYELLVDGREVIALHPKFRIALSFPDLTMMGENSFFSITCAPNAIRDALYKVVGREIDESW